MADPVSYSIGELVELAVTDLSSEGDGVGRVDGTVVFVRGGVPGDRVQARVLRVRKNRVEAEVARLLEPSPDRVEPVCPHQPECGGCPLMVLSPEAALKTKAAHLAQTLRRLGGVEHGVDRTVPSPDPLEYRNRVAFAVVGDGRRRKLAFRARGEPSRKVPIDRCHLVPEGVTRGAQELVDRLSAAAAGSKGRRAPLERLEMRGSHARSEWLAAVHTGEGPWPGFRRAANRWVDAAPERAGVVRVETARDGRVLRERTVAGRSSVTEHIGGVGVELSAGSFLQVNPRVAERLYAVVSEMLSGDGGKRPTRVLDLYCGAGLVGALSVPDAAELVGVERHGPSLRRARRLVGERSGWEWVRGDAAEVARGLADAGRRFDAVVVNPPRAGTDPALPAILAELDPQRAVVVSCHPAALARDLGRLVGHGFRVEEVVALDMFPQTQHLEAAVRLERAGEKG
jgi:23S rRNA (uracil1939-C5)-methyltransferase